MPAPSATPVSDKSELAMVGVVEASGWSGPVGIIHERGNLDTAEGIKGNLQCPE